MKAIGSKDTKPELALRRACHALGLRCRLHRRDLPGTPDMAFVSAKVAVFVDGDFWHGRKWFEEGKAPKSNTEAWIAKFERNRERDNRAVANLRETGWLPLRLWESDVLRRPIACARLIKMIVKSRQAMNEHGSQSLA